MPDFGKLFGNDTLDFLVQVQNLDERVTTELAPIEGDLDGSASEPFLDGRLEISGEAEIGGSLTIPRFGDEVVVYGGEGHAPHRGYTFGVLELDASVGVVGGGKGSAGAFTLGLSGRARARLRYRHLVEAHRTVERRELLEALVRRSRTPGKLQIQRVGDTGDDLLAALAAANRKRIHEVHEWQLELGFEIGAEVVAGWSIEEAFQTTVFNQASGELRASLRAGLQAAFGLERWEETRLSVGTLGLSQEVEDADGWVRIHVARADQRRLGIGVHFALEMTYDGTGLRRILDHVLEISGFARLRAAVEGTMAQVASDGENDPPALPDSLEVLTAALGDELSEDLLDFVDPDRTLSAQVRLERWLDASRRIEAFLFSVDQLEPELRGFLESALGYAKLQPGRPLRVALERLAVLEEASLREFLERLASPAGREIQMLVEVFSGASVEEILTALDPREPIESAVASASQLAEVLARIDPQLLALLEDFVARTGVAKAVETIRSVDLSVGDQALAGQPAWIRRLADKVAGGLVTTEQQEALEEWAAGVAELLDDVAAAEKKLEAAFERLSGKVGFSLGIELERITRNEALLDIDIDASDKGCRDAFQELVDGRIDRFLRALPEKEGGEDDPYRIHQGLFTTQRSATRSVALFASFWGSSMERRQRVAQRTVRLLPDGGGRREADYAGGFVQSVARDKGSDSASSMGTSFWVRVHAKGPGKDLAAAYEEEASSLLLTATRSDDALTLEELEATLRLLADFGFLATTQISLPNNVKVASRLSLRLALPTSAVPVFFGTDAEVPGVWDGDGWDRDFLNAGRRWFDEPLTPQGLAHHHPPVLEGEVYAATLKPGDFAEWRALGSAAFLAQTQSGLSISYPLPQPPGGSLNLTVQTKAGPGNALAQLIFVSGNAPDSFKQASRARTEVKGHERPAQIERFCWRAAKAARAACPTSWPNPMLPIWLMLARVGRLQPEVLAESRGAAILRTREGDDWQDPVVLHLPDGIKRPTLGHPFPFPFS